MTIGDTIRRLEDKLGHDSRTIIEIEIIDRSYPLAKTYELSFASLTRFLSFEVSLKLSDGSESKAEVVPLLGYSSESPEYILDYLKDRANVLKGLTLVNARTFLSADIQERPFSVTALLTAIDSFFFEVRDKPVDMAFCLPASSKKIQDTTSLIARLKRAETIKVKLSGNYDVDSEAIRALGSTRGHLLHRYRLDANQAYELEDAGRLFSFLRNSEMHAQIDYVEQPLAADNWSDHGKLLSNFPDIPVMLDESIVTTSEVERAHEMGIPFVKLKLFKQGGILELMKTTQLANELGMGVILGNGVATWTSNRVEIEVYHRFRELYQAPLEANGFLKINTSEV